MKLYQRVRWCKSNRNCCFAKDTISLNWLPCQLALYCFRPAMRSGSSMILSALSVADTLTLGIGPTPVYLTRAYKITVSNYFIICKLHRYLRLVFGYYANWLIIVFTIFRVIAVYLPHKANVYCTRRRAFIAVVLSFVVSCIVNLDSILHVQYSHNAVGKKCSRDKYYKIYTQWVMLVIMSIIPFVVLVTGNILIICKIVTYSIKRKRMSNDVKSNDSQSMTAMLISISVLFLVTQVPAIIINIYKQNLGNVTKEYIHGFAVTETVFRLMKWSNHGLNFFCYCISGERFREEMCAMLKGWFRRKRNGNIGTKAPETSFTSALSNMDTMTASVANT